MKKIKGSKCFYKTWTAGLQWDLRRCSSLERGGASEACLHFSGSTLKYFEWSIWRLYMHTNAGVFHNSQQKPKQWTGILKDAEDAGVTGCCCFFTPLSCRTFPHQQPMQYLLTVSSKRLMAAGIQVHLTLNLFFRGCILLILFQGWFRDQAQSNLRICKG